MIRNVFFLMLCLALHSPFCRAEQASSEWTSDCVGKMQLSFPGEVEVAANSHRAIVDSFKKAQPQPQFVFPDGQTAGWSSLHYMGRLLVSHPLPDDQRKEIAAAAKQRAVATRARAQSEKRTYERLPLRGLEGEAYRVDSQVALSIFVSSVFLRLSSSSDAPWSERKDDVSMFLTPAAYRHLGDVPQGPGLCLPYLFVGDDGRSGRSIGTTYRLKDHPDVTVMLQDTSAPRVTSGQNPAQFTAQAMSDFFWTQNYGFSVRKSVSSEWTPVYRTFRFASRDAVESFVRIVRKDDSEDFGYLAVSRGDPDAKEDTPDLTLYVIRDARNARAKGVHPIDKAAFLDMARRIAASVKLRDLR